MGLTWHCLEFAGPGLGIDDEVDFIEPTFDEVLGVLRLDTQHAQENPWGRRL